MPLAVDALLPAGVDAARSTAHRLARAGADGAFSPETVSDPFMDLLLPGLETDLPAFGTAVAIAFARSPFVTAVSAWRLQEVSKGRFVLGLGSQVKGHIERRFGLKWESPGPKMREYLAALRALWKAFRKEQKLDFSGRYYNFSLLPSVFDPGPIPYADPPIYLAAINDHNLETVGLLADGLASHPIAAPRFLKEVALPIVEKGLASSGRTRANIIVQSPVILVTGDTAAEREATASYARLQIAWSGSTRTYSRIFESLGWEDMPRRLHQLMSSGDFPGMISAITDEMLGEFAVVADPDVAASAVRERYSGVADRVLFYNLLSTSIASDEDRLRNFVADVRQ